MVEEGFLTQIDRDLICFTDSYDELNQFVEKYRTPNIRQY